jgi:hypothetical protein
MNVPFLVACNLNTLYASKISNFPKHKRRDAEINKEMYILSHLKLPAVISKAEGQYPQKYLYHCSCVQVQ